MIVGRCIDAAFTAWGRNWSNMLAIGVIAFFVYVVAFILCIVPAFFVQGPLTMALFAPALAALRGEQVSVDMMGRGLERPGPVIVVGLVFGTIQLVLLVAIYAVVFMMMLGTMGLGVGAEQSSALEVVPAFFGMFFVQIVLMFALLALQIFLAARLLYVFPLLIERELTVTEAIRASWEASRERFWEHALLVLFAGFLVTAGSYLCYIGAALTTPIAICVIAEAYRLRFEEGTG